jgi:hypothetical protein
MTIAFKPAPETACSVVTPETVSGVVTPAQNHAAAPASGPRLAVGMIFAGVLVLIAIIAVLASPAMDLASMPLIGP